MIEGGIVKIATAGQKAVLRQQPILNGYGLLATGAVVLWLIDMVNVPERFASTDKEKQLALEAIGYVGSLYFALGTILVSLIMKDFKDRVVTGKVISDNWY